LDDGQNNSYLHSVKRIGLISDTHGFLDDAVFSHFANCDEIWHSGDFGSWELVEKLQGFKPLRGVYGNIDGHEIRASFPERLRFECEGVEVLMIHIGGYPGRYAPTIRGELTAHPPQLFISGHSHILKIMFDERLKCLHMNAGAAGKQGWQTMRTLIRFEVNEGIIGNCEVIELGLRQNIIS
jgi:putative phosphoesterase